MDPEKPLPKVPRNYVDWVLSMTSDDMERMIWRDIILRAFKRGKRISW